MYEVKENSRILKDGTEITTYIRDVVSCNILEVEAGTTGYCGGDTGHGGRTYFRIQDAACTDMEIHSYTTRCGSNGFEVCLGGDCELETMIRALKYIPVMSFFKRHIRMKTSIGTQIMVRLTSTWLRIITKRLSVIQTSTQRMLWLINEPQKKVLKKAVINISNVMHSQEKYSAENVETPSSAGYALTPHTSMSHGPAIRT